MPTKEQLSRIWETEMEFPETRRDDDPMKPPIRRNQTSNHEQSVILEDMSSKSKYITTTLPYCNSLPHIGHCFEFVMADIITRFWKRKIGVDHVFFNTGIDEHGVKIQQEAEKLGITPQAFCEKKSIEWMKFCETLQIHYTRFYRTSSIIHKRKSLKFFNEIKNQLELKQYSGLYCVGCESFKTEKEIVDGKCPIHQVDLVPVIEENFFFNLSKYADEIKDILVDKTLSKELEGIKETFREISITRKNIDWAVKIDEENSLYVWFEALLNYIFTIGYYEHNPYVYQYFKNFWEESVIICGKDNLKFQAFILQAMLKANGIPQTKEVLVHGTILDKDGIKMSKSLGNVIDPIAQVNKFGVSPLRYYLFFGLNTFSDAKYSEEELKTIWNSEVCNNFGNLISRTLHLIDTREVSLNQDLVNVTAINRKTRELDECFSSYRFQDARQAIQVTLAGLNKLISDSKPWEKECVNYADILRTIYFSLKALGPYFSIILPEYEERIDQAFRNRKKVVLFPHI